MGPPKHKKFNCSVHKDAADHFCFMWSCLSVKYEAFDDRIKVMKDNGDCKKCCCEYPKGNCKAKGKSVRWWKGWASMWNKSLPAQALSRHRQTVLRGADQERDEDCWRGRRWSLLPGDADTRHEGYPAMQDSDVGHSLVRHLHEE